LPAVASSIAAEGLHATPGRDLLVADQPADFCAQVAALYRDQALWSRLSQNGINLVEEHFSFRAVQSEVEQLLAEFAPSRPLVSVIIPVYNGERFLAEALHSVLSQDYQPIEVIVVDDGSTDRSSEIIHSFEGIRTIRQANQGVGAARNAGIEVAQGEFITFLDQDDTWTPDKLSVQIGYLLKHPAVGYVLAHQKLFLVEGAARPSWLRPELLEKPPVGYLPGTLVARKHLFRQIGLFDPAYATGSDSDWFFRARGAGVSMAILPEVLLHRKIHNQNQSYETLTAHRELFSILRRSIHQQQSGGAGRKEG
jgi:GT2 family glycosyltransferase